MRRLEMNGVVPSKSVFVDSTPLRFAVKCNYCICVIQWNPLSLTHLRRKKVSLLLRCPAGACNVHTQAVWDSEIAFYQGACPLFRVCLLRVSTVHSLKF